jgi:integrase
VFYGPRGAMIEAHLRGWREACSAAGLPGLLFHDLRRSAVRNMKRAGVSDKTAMNISGHKTRAIFDRYDIVDEADVEAAGEKLGQYFSARKASRAAKLRRVK